MSVCCASVVLGECYIMSSPTSEMLRQVLGGEEILQLPKKTEDLVPGQHNHALSNVCVNMSLRTHQQLI